MFSDDDPVPAVRELVESGALVATPTTHLVHDPTDIRDPA
jgi:hypothetical protein